MPDRSMCETRTIPSDPSCFRSIRDWLAAVARTKGFDEQEALELTVAVNEACANIHRHAYAGSADRPIEVHMEIGEAMLSLRIRDYGSRFRPERSARPDLTDPAEGGYGLFLIRELMDEVEYIQKDSGTELRMNKRRRRRTELKKGENDVGRD